ncbi:MAG: FG-GAP-like repeat-containing protein, partial [Candidatus Latescibacteria bacterium]|nr:FG-GAP-like repeat-containing protein [Candidatus Latescibacterota bacterium]
MSSINETQGCSQKICSLPSAPFSMIMVDLDGTGHPLPIIGGFDGRVYVVRGRRAVELAEVGGWSTGLAAGDLDGDGREEVLCASGDNPSHLYNIRADGEVIWKQEAEVCWMGAGVARSKSGLMVVGVDFRGGISVFSSDGELIRKITHFEKADGTSQRLVDMSALSVGDLDGDGVDEIVVGGYWGGLYAFRLDGSLLWLCDTTTPLVEEGEQNSGVSVAKHVTTNGRDYVIDLQRGGKFVRHIQIADLDGDGRPEVICGLFRSDLFVADCEGNKMWSKVINDDVVDHMIGYVHMDQRGCFKDSVAKSQPCSIVVDRPDGLGKWIVALQPREDLMETTPNFGAADIFVFDADGNELCRDISGAPWFRLAAHPVKSDTVCIATGISESALYEIQMADLIERGSGIKWTRVPQAVQNWTDLLTQL